MAPGVQAASRSPLVGAAPGGRLGTWWPPHTSTLNLAFTEHITNALIKAREEKLRVEASIPRKLYDGWDPMIKIKLNNFSCYALCDVGASTSVMPKRIFGMFELKPFEPCSFGVRLFYS